MQRALAEHAGLDAKQVAQRMMGYTDAKTLPSAARYAALLSRDTLPQGEPGQPYPFFLAHQIDAADADFEARIGPPAQWLVEWKYDGIRAQIVKRGGHPRIGRRRRATRWPSSRR